LCQKKLKRTGFGLYHNKICETEGMTIGAKKLYSRGGWQQRRRAEIRAGEGARISNALPRAAGKELVPPRTTRAVSATNKLQNRKVK
jgi:hypothetical protein